MKSPRIRKYVVLSLLSAIVLLLQAAPTHASGNAWYDKYVTWDSTHGGDYYTDDNASNLGWGEGYVLRSYMNMYELTGSTTWLDKITTHFDAMISNASDFDGDGYLDWTTPNYSAKQVANSTFASAASGDYTLPASWTRFQSTSSTAYRSSSAGEYYPGSDTVGLVLKTNGTSWQKLYQTLSTYEPGRKNSLTFNAKTNGSTAKGNAYIWDATTSTMLASVVIDSTAWKAYNINFDAPDAGHSLQVWLGHNDYSITGGIVYYDNVQVSARYAYMVHDGMIGLPIAKFIRLVNENPAVLSAYVSKANTYETFLEKNTVAKWHDSASWVGNTWVNVSSTEGYYKEPSTMDTLPGVNYIPLPYNMMLVFADLQMTLYDVNHNADYLDRAKKVNQYFKNRLTTSGSAYEWNYWNTTTPAPVAEDTSHGNLDLESAVDMYEHNLVFTGADIDKFTSAYVNRMWNGSLTSPLVSGNVTGTGNPSMVLWSWTRLSPFSADVWPITAKQFASFTPTYGYEAHNFTEIMKWDPVKVVNQGFEWKTTTDSTLPARWLRVGTASTVYLDSVNKTKGDYGLTVASNTTSIQALYQVWTQWKPNTAYVLTFDGKSSGGSTGGRLFVQNKTTNTLLTDLKFTNTAWGSKTLTFTTPAATSDELRIYLENGDYSLSGNGHFDNIVIKQSGDAW